MTQNNPTEAPIENHTAESYRTRPNKNNPFSIVPKIITLTNFLTNHRHPHEHYTAESY